MIPVLEYKENLIYLYHDTEFIGIAPSFNLGQVEIIIQSNNIALYSHSHFYPLPTTTSLIDELDRAFTSLAERMLNNYAEITPRSNLIVLPMANLEKIPGHPLPRVPGNQSDRLPLHTPRTHSSQCLIPHTGQDERRRTLLE